MKINRPTKKKENRGKPRLVNEKGEERKRVEQRERQVNNLTSLEGTGKKTTEVLKSPHGGESHVNFKENLLEKQNLRNKSSAIWGGGNRDEFSENKWKITDQETLFKDQEELRIRGRGEGGSIRCQ